MQGLNGSTTEKVISSQLKSILKRPKTLDDLGIPAALVTDLIYRLLFSEGDVSVARCAQVLKINAQLLSKVLSDMKQEHHIEIAKAGSLGALSYVYRLTETGVERARGRRLRSQAVRCRWYCHQ